MKTKKAFVIGVIATLVFTALIVWVASGLGDFRKLLLPDSGPAWYFWKLPLPRLWATVTMWTLYAAHQILCWVLIYRLQHRSALRPQGDRIGRYNAALLIVNGVFILLHMLQTRFFYDALAQYVPVFSSQYSVIGMLALMLILANVRRGLFFGKKVRLPQAGVAGIGKTHGYYISWAIVYTFWFHPMDGTWSHLLGFLYLMLLMLQMSMAYTKVHTNLKWVTLLEVFVALHGTVVALEAGQMLWSMFLFGFAMMFIVTQMYGVVRHKALRIAITTVYAAAALIVYSGVLGTGHVISQIHQLFWIPAILYGLAFAVVWLFEVAIRIFRKKDRSVPLAGGPKHNAGESA